MEPLPRSIVWDLSNVASKSSRYRSNVAIHPCNRRVEVMPTILSSEHVIDDVDAHRSVSEVALDRTPPDATSEMERVFVGSDVSGTVGTGSVGHVSANVSEGTGSGGVVKPDSTAIEMEMPSKTSESFYHPATPPATPAAAFFRSIRPECHRLETIHTKPLRERIFLLDFDLFEFVLLSELFFTVSFFMFSMILLAIGMNFANTMLVSVSFGSISIPSMVAYTKTAPEIALVFFSILTMIECMSEVGVIIHLYVDYHDNDRSFIDLTVQTYLLLFLGMSQCLAGLVCFLWPYKPIKKIQTCSTIKHYAVKSWERYKQMDEPYEITEIDSSHYLITEPTTMTTKTGSETNVEPPLVPLNLAELNLNKPSEAALKSTPIGPPPKPTVSPKKVPSIVEKVTSTPVKTETVKVPAKKDPHKPARSVPKEASTEGSDVKSEKDEIKVTRKSKTPPSKALPEPPRTPIEPHKANLPTKKPSSTGSDSRNISVEMPSPPRNGVGTVVSSFAPMKLGASASNPAKPKELEPMSDQDKPTRTPEITR
uniref:Uncharacterized protein n=1 Tax=Panagrellus redivivus TaxID=6233 RepID=A0A7E4ZUJ0_PANRE